MERAAAVPAEEWFAEHPEALPVYARVRELFGPVGSYEVRITRSQLAFRRRRGFAYVRLLGPFLDSDVVAVSVALERRLDSARFKQVVQPRPHLWMHHLEVHDLTDLDDEVGAR